MKIMRNLWVMLVGLALRFGAASFSSGAMSVHAQNRISGFVFGVNRQPIGEVYVELIDEYYSTVARVKTNSAGRYSFSGMSDGRFTIRVSATGTLYEDGEAPVQLVNYTRENSNGSARTTAFENQQVDIILKLRRGVTPASAALFVQVVPPEAKRLYERALEDLDTKREAEAITGLKSALEIFPTYFDALERLGTEYVKLGRPEGYMAAAVLFSKAIEVNPRAVKSYHGLAYSLYSRGDYPNALKAAQKAVELNGSSPDALFLLGVLLKHAKQYDEAEKNLLKASEFSNGANPKIHWELATLYGNTLHRYADAARELRAFLKAQPDAKDAEIIRKLIADFDAKALKK
jgi:tetratricopeptide (TPR) repeat protein